MGTLTDITARAGNTMKRRSTSSIGYKSLDSPVSTKKLPEKENSAKSKSPHFMTPTFSSSSQSVATTPNTPVPLSRSSKAETSSTWMKSAAKRVHLRRTGDGMPRSKKEGPSKSPKTISFPDKLATPSNSRVLDTPPSIKTQTQKVSPTDKPLPNPPSGQVCNPGYLIESKTLIDASDKPLRRRSPPGMGVHEEDWPVLYPKRPTNPQNLQEMMRETGLQLTQQAVSGQKERYPILGNTLRQVPDEELPISRYSATYRDPCKEIFSFDPDKVSSGDKDTATGNAQIDDPFKVGVYDSGPVVPAKTLRTGSTSPSDLSAGAAAVEKSAQGSKSTIEPRQNRTSSLRARLSAGQIVKDGQNKVIGFTDFTAIPNPATSATRRDSLRARKEAQARRSRTPTHSLGTNPSSDAGGGDKAQTGSSITPPANPVQHPLRTNPSRESISGNRAPAQFVAGSRRPKHPRRPSSHGSLRGNVREPTPPLPTTSSNRNPPSRPAPAVPAPRDEETKHGKASEKAQIQDPPRPRKSFIPVPRQVMPDMQEQPHKNDKTVASNPNEVVVDVLMKQPRDEFATSEGQSSLDMVRDLDQRSSDSSSDTARDFNQLHSASHPAQALVDSYGAHVLEAIEESPKHAYKLKRLSTASPEFGPTLKISPSAERFIMGPDTKKEKISLNKKKSKELDRSTMKNDQQDRPSSSQGLSRLGSRVGLLDTKAREKKVKSADLTKISPAIDHLLTGSHKLTPRLNHESTNASNNGSSTRTSFNDPFYDARSQLQAGPEKINDVYSQEPDAAEEESQSPPFAEGTSISSNEKPASTGFLLSSSHLGNDSETGPERSDGGNHGEDKAVCAKDDAKEPIDDNDDTSVIHLPSTPEQRPSETAADSGSHPPRSSSRMAHPDFTRTKNSPESPLSTENGPPTPLKVNPQDFARRQDNLGSLRGHDTSQLDLSNQGSKRDSAAGESSKSQASATKGSLSIFRGLFHKRSSDNEPLKPTNKKSKSKPTPIPPISEVHPIHRPTLASVARSAASTPRPAAAAATATGTRPGTPANPSPFSPLLPSEPSSSAHLAMELLDLSRKERSSPQKEKLLRLGSVMVEGITQARNAEKAMEEAKQAARRAEVAYALCKKSLKEVTVCVEAWRRGD